MLRFPPLLNTGVGLKYRTSLYRSSTIRFSGVNQEHHPERLGKNGMSGKKVWKKNHCGRVW